MSTYTTKQGDAWDLIAYQQMGSCTFTKELMWANRMLLDYFIFPAGVVLTIPETTGEVAADFMPPWKKAST